MSRREDIDNAIWSDPDFENLSLEATALYLWSFTNPRCGMAGIYKVSHRAMTESKVPLDRLESTLSELAVARFLFYEDGVMFVRTRVRHLRQKTVQIAKSIAADVAKLPAGHPMLARWFAENGELAWLTTAESEGHLTLNRPSGDPHPNGSSKPKAVTLNRPSPEGHLTLQGNGNGNGNGTGRDRGAGERADEPPGDFPDALLPTLPNVVAVLERIAGARKANAVTIAATARAMASYPLRPHLKAAEDLEHWLVYGTGQRSAVKDVVAYYRNQLDRRWQDQAMPGTAGGPAGIDDQLARAERARAERRAREEASA